MAPGLQAPVTKLASDLLQVHGCNLVLQEHKSGSGSQSHWQKELSPANVTAQDSHLGHTLPESFPAASFAGNDGANEWHSHSLKGGPPLPDRPAFVPELQ